jgi:hypothetical protein
MISSPIIKTDAIPLLVTLKSHSNIVSAAIPSTDWADLDSPAGVGNERINTPASTARHIPAHFDFVMDTTFNAQQQKKGDSYQIPDCRPFGLE